MSGSREQRTITAVIDGREVTVPEGTTILKAAESAGITIPVFCYHKHLSISGSCRMCLVEVKGGKKPVTACSTELAQDVVVHTTSPGALQARRDMMMHLLINHPLDCPVCDKGGECLLQDNSYDWGAGTSPFQEEKRRFEKPVALSDRILLDRERCILCTRCVRFCDEISDHRQLAIIGRGGASFIDTAPGATFESQFSGNTTEICPVGALTAKSFRFKARPWEMESTPSICPFCSCGCNIFINTRSGKIMRFMSRENPDVDVGWLCDRGRYGFERINSAERLVVPLLRKKGQLTEVSWDEAISAAVSGLQQGKKIHGQGVIAGLGSAWALNEENTLLNRLISDSLGSSHIDLAPGDEGVAAGQALAEGVGAFALMDIIKADSLILLGADPSERQPIVDLWLKKAVLQQGAELLLLHPQRTEMARYAAQTLAYTAGSEDPLLRLLTSLLMKDRRYDGQEGDLAAAGLLKADLERACAWAASGRARLVLVDASFFTSEVRVYLLKEFMAALGNNATSGVLFASPNGYGAALYSRDAAKGKKGAERGLSGEEILLAAEEGRIKDLYILNLDRMAEETAERAKKGADLILGHALFLKGAARHADILFPSAAFSEKTGSMTNTSGLTQDLHKALDPPGAARPEAQVLQRMLDLLGMSKA
ncbi:MAG: NADH dehydrogenase (quinone) subunit G [Nitrospirae bacterium GWC2_57_13]|nr:MAG: NADH dehydrogenase (quinone) subunit G [Nitrospirae bacterium GWC2_57_13]